MDLTIFEMEFASALKHFWIKQVCYRCFDSAHDDIEACNHYFNNEGEGSTQGPRDFVTWREFHCIFPFKW